MGLGNCPECGKLYLENPSGMCPACYAQVEEDELKVANYLREARKASLDEIHRATGVKESVIMRMIKRGRVFSDFEVTYPCETCGALISDGRICARCSKGILDQVKPIAESTWQSNETKESRKSHERMYTNSFGQRKK